MEYVTSKAAQEKWRKTIEGVRKEQESLVPRRFEETVGVH